MLIIKYRKCNKNCESNLKKTTAFVLIYKPHLYSFPETKDVKFTQQLMEKLAKRHIVFQFGMHVMFQLLSK